MKTLGPCDYCHCSYDSHGEDLICPDFAFGEFRGWLDTRYLNAEAIEALSDNQKLLEQVAALQKENVDYRDQCNDLLLERAATIHENSHLREENERLKVDISLYKGTLDEYKEEIKRWK